MEKREGRDEERARDRVEIMKEGKIEINNERGWWERH